MQPTSPPQDNQPSRRPSVVGPAILIILGLAFLAQNLHIFDFNIWNALWRLWPVWLIAVGLDLMLGRRTSWGSWLVVGLVLSVVGGAVWWDAAVGSRIAVGLGDPIAISQPANGAKRAEVFIDSSISELRIKGGGSANLVEGVVKPLETEQIEKNAYNSGDTLVFSLKSQLPGRGVNLPFGRNITAPTWDLQISDQIPINLRIDTGIGESFIDLSRTQLVELEVDSGVGESEITLPSTGRFKVDIDSGVGEVTLRVPKELAVYIRIDQGVGGVQVRGDYQRDGKAWVSPNYAQSQNRAEIEIDGGVGQLNVVQF